MALMGNITATVAGRTTPLSVVDYTVSEDATPLAPGDSSGGVGDISITAVAVKDGLVTQRTTGIIDRDVVLSDLETVEATKYQGRGTVFGHINRSTENGARVSVTAETLISRLNTDRVAKPFFGVRSQGVNVTYATNVATNPSLETATTNYTAVPGTSGTAAVSRSNATYSAFAGSWHGRVTWTGAATVDGGGVSYAHTGVTAGDTLFISMRALTSRQQQSMRMSIVWRNASNTVISTTFGAPAIINSISSGYATIAVNGVAPVGTTNILVNLFNYNGGTGTPSFANWANGDILVFDGLMICTQNIPYFDGSFPNSSWLGTANASGSQTAISTPYDTGYNATLGNAVRYYLGLVGITETAIVVDPLFENVTVAFPAWEGNVWNYMKQLCTAVGAEIAMSGETVLFRAPRQNVVQFENQASLNRGVDAQASALNVEIYNYNSSWGISSPAYAATSATSVTIGVNSEFTVKVEHSLTKVNNPVPVSNMSPLETYTGPGQYMVIDANDVVVSPDLWTSYGGRVTAELVYGTYDSIKITVYAPQSVGVYTGPFRIAQTDIAGNDLPAMYITGDGVFIDKQLVTIATGASDTQTSTVTAPTIDNVFISNAQRAGDRGVLAAMQASGPAITINGTTTFSRTTTGSDFSNFVGGRVFYDSNVYRVTSAQFTTSQIEFSGVADVVFGDVTSAYSVTFAENNTTYSGFNFTAYNALWTGKTFAQVMALSPTPSFDSVNAIYAGMSFNEHAVYPLLEVRPNAEARF